MEVKIKKFKKVLLNWYSLNKRDFSWRNDKNPWNVYLLETISQQTQLNRANKYFDIFIKEFPSPDIMAKSSLRKVLKLWSGLGYNIRAKRMHETSKILSKKPFNELYPDFQQLPGIGPYTENAIRSFSYGDKVITEDTNVKRVVSRYFGIDNEKIFIKKYSFLLLENVDSRNINQAFMDFGSIVCKPRNPCCLKCPLSQNCKKYFSSKTKKREEFRGSKREIRGNIIKLLLKNQKIGLNELSKKLKISKDNLAIILSTMQKEGLIILNKKNIVEINPK